MTVSHYKFYTAYSKYNKTVVTKEYKVLLHCNISSINAEFQIKILHRGFESESSKKKKQKNGPLNRKCLEKDSMGAFFCPCQELREEAEAL